MSEVSDDVVHSDPDCFGDDYVACIVDWTGRPNLYGPCSDDLCGGICDHIGACTCSCHTEPRDPA